MNIFIAICGLSVLILIHELGHYWTARLFRMPVLAFSIGFGPTLYQYHNKQGTVFYLKAILLGGYVRFLESAEAKPGEKAFDDYPIWQRMVVVLAGPLTNLLCAFLLFVFLGLSGITGLKPLVGHVLDGSPAAATGLKEGDQITSVGERPVYLWQDVVWYLLPAIGKREVELSWETEDKVPLKDSIDLSQRNIGEIEETPISEFIGIEPKRVKIPAVIGRVEDGSAADRAGFTEGDEVLKINGQEITDWNQLRTQVAAAPEQELSIQVRRDGKLVSLAMTPTLAENGNGRAGVAPRVPENLREISAELFTRVQYPLSQIWAYATRQIYIVLDVTAKTLYELVHGRIGLDSLSGPVRIVDVVGSSVESGLQPFVQVMAFINLSLFFLNLLPIPALDGGHLVLYATEALLRRKPSRRIVFFYQSVGFIFLISLFLLVTFNDISSLL